MQEPTLLPETEVLSKEAREAIALLSELIAVPSFSREEDRTAAILADFLEKRGVKTHRSGNNVWAFNRHRRDGLPAVLLNSHHDTVKPNAAYTKDPLAPILSEGKLYGLGSNDAGGALVSLLMTFLHFYDRSDLQYNLVFAATAEEEISGTGGVASILDRIGPVTFGIVGEPTGMHLAAAEKGLMVLDCTAHGTPAHAAHGEADNAIYNAMKDIQWFRSFRFAEVSELLGEIRMNVTMIQAGTQHNVIPGKCTFTVDVRTTDALTNQQVLDVIKRHVSSEVHPRSLRLNPSSISLSHPVVGTAKALGRKIYGSPTISDQALMNFPTVKMGPGESQRSHSSDEFIYLHEIEEGITLYTQLLSKLLTDEQ
jgi:acetylornithine deacetylase